MLELTPDQLFEKYQNGKMDRSTLLNQLKLLIETSPKEALRVDSLKAIQSICNSSSDLYVFIENLLVSDANPLIRATAAEIILNNYMEQGIKAIKWAINSDKSWECLLRIFELLKVKKTEVSEVLLKEIENSIGKPYIEKCGLDPEEAIYLGLLKKSKYYSTFYISGCWETDTTDSMISITTENGFITKMRFRNSFPNFDIIKSFQKLKKINIISDSKEGFEGLSKLPQLEVLILEECLFRTKKELKWLVGLVSLKELQLIDTFLEEIPDLSSLKNLEVLKIKPYDHSEFKGYVSEINGLEDLENLKELSLKYNRITEIKGLEKLKNLRVLDLSENKIREIKGLENLTNLRRLDLFKNRIREIKCLNQLINLKELHLTRNKILELKNVENLKNLEYLFLERNKIPEEELKPILRKLELKRKEKYLIIKKRGGIDERFTVN